VHTDRPTSHSPAPPSAEPEDPEDEDEDDEDDAPASSPGPPDDAPPSPPPPPHATAATKNAKSPKPRVFCLIPPRASGYHFGAGGARRFRERPQFGAFGQSTLAPKAERATMVSAPMSARLRPLSLAVAVSALALAAGCGSRGPTAKTALGETVPLIEVSPGVAGRLAVMDAYRQHDETRKHMMWRPEVTVEELPPEEAVEAAPPSDAAAPSLPAPSLPAPSPEPDGDLDLGVSATTPRPPRTSR
jgi:hypothetical protein